MDKKHENDFKELLAIWDDITPGSDLTVRKIRGYLFFALQSDLKFREIEEAGYRSIREKGYFPKINDLFGSQKDAIEIQAQKDIEYIESLLLNYYFPEFGESSMNVIGHKLKETQREYLLPMIRRFGLEIIRSSNPSATRAQMLKAYKADTEYKQLQSCDNKKLTEKVDELIEGMVG